MHRAALLPAVGVCLLTFASQLCTGADPHPGTLFGKFVGSTPREKEVSKFLGISDSKEIECTWTLDLYEDNDQQPTAYELTCEIGKYSFDKPKTQQKREAIAKSGKWNFGKWSGKPNARTIELEGGLKLLEVSKNVLHCLGAKNELIVGNGGYSYSLNRADATEKPGDWHLAMAKPDGPPYKIAPLSTGANVYGVFEGRTPYKGIAQQLKHPWDEGCIKAKWRITLYQDEKTKAPTEYKVEGSLFKPESRTGKWSLKKDENGQWPQIVLEATSTQPELALLVGDENVIFIADKKSEPLVGHSEFSYTMNRQLEEK